MTIYRDAILARWPRMQDEWVSDLAALMQQVTESQLPAMESDLRTQLVSERLGRDEYAIENHRLRGEMARVREENAKLQALAAPPIDEIAAILYPASLSERSRKGFTKAVNAVAEWLDLVAPESVPEVVTEPAVQVEQQEATQEKLQDQASATGDTDSAVVEEKAAPDAAVVEPG